MASISNVKTDYWNIEHKCSQCGNNFYTHYKYKALTRCLNCKSNRAKTKRTDYEARRNEIVRDFNEKYNVIKITHSTGRFYLDTQRNRLPISGSLYTINSEKTYLRYLYELKELLEKDINTIIEKLESSKKVL